MKNKIIVIFILFIYIFAFCSSVYCVSLILQRITNTNDNYLSLAFFICIFLVGTFLNVKEQIEEEK